MDETWGSRHFVSLGLDPLVSGAPEIARPLGDLADGDAPPCLEISYKVHKYLTQSVNGSSFRRPGMFTNASPCEAV
jgi:hypothetical protein